MKYLTFFISFAMLLLCWINVAQAQEPLLFEYISPVPGAKLVSAGTTIAVRHGEDIDEDSLSSTLFSISGSQSGLHQGQMFLADDDKTVIIRPEQPFAPGENVRVMVSGGLVTISGQVLEGTTFEFTISPKRPAELSEAVTLETLFGESPAEIDLTQVKTTGSSMPAYVAAPVDLPEITITSPPEGTDQGYLFLSNIPWQSPSQQQRYLLILDDSGGRTA